MSNNNNNMSKKGLTCPFWLELIIIVLVQGTAIDSRPPLSRPTRMLLQETLSDDYCSNLRTQSLIIIIRAKVGAKRNLNACQVANLSRTSSGASGLRQAKRDPARYECCLASAKGVGPSQWLPSSLR